MAMTDRRYSSTRIAISNGCASVGVLLLILASVSPAGWYPTVQLFLGLAFIAVSHVLTPCQERITQWRNARNSKPSRNGAANESLPSNPTVERDARKSGARPSP